jgi:hypothetical protein
MTTLADIVYQRFRAATLNLTFQWMPTFTPAQRRRWAKRLIQRCQMGELHSEGAP